MRSFRVKWRGLSRQKPEVSYIVGSPTVSGLHRHDDGCPLPSYAHDKGFGVVTDVKYQDFEVLATWN